MSSHTSMAVDIFIFHYNSFTNSFFFLEMFCPSLANAAASVTWLTFMKATCCSSQKEALCPPSPENKKHSVNYSEKSQHKRETVEINEIIIYLVSRTFVICMTSPCVNVLKAGPHLHNSHYPIWSGTSFIKRLSFFPPALIASYSPLAGKLFPRKDAVVLFMRGENPFVQNLTARDLQSEAVAAIFTTIFVGIVVLKKNPSHFQDFNCKQLQCIESQESYSTLMMGRL